MDLDYNEVAAWCEAIKNPRPSGMGPDSRRHLLDYLATEKGRSAFLDWKEDR
jgi:hypothetical protein